MSNEAQLSGSSFIPKEARFNPFRRVLMNGADDVGQNPSGRFVDNYVDDAANKKVVDQQKLSPEEVGDYVKRQRIGNGTGGIIGDAGLGLTKFVSPAARNKIDKGLNKTKEVADRWDNKAGKALAGDDVNSLRGRFFSRPTGVKKDEGVPVERVKYDDGSESYLYEGAGGENRTPSASAMVTNPLKVATPFMATMFAADKMYGGGQQPQTPGPPRAKPQPEFNSSDWEVSGTSTNTEPTELPEMPKSSSKYSNDEEKHGILEEEDYSLSLDKEASMQKIAQLEDQLEKRAEEVQHFKYEAELMAKEATAEREKRSSIEQDLEMEKQAALEKKAEAEEFRLRTIARERSKIAVSLAEDMLESGLVKQANFDAKVDQLMDCDEDTLNLYASMIKEAKKEEEGLESLAYLVDYRSNDTDNLPAETVRGLSKRGQTIGEAAEDLIR